MLRSSFALATIAISIGAAAAQAALPPRVLVSGTGVPDCTAPGQVRGYEAEPSLAADPSGRLLVAAWQQDRRGRTGGGATANMIGISKDGGATWERQLVTGLAKCGGGTSVAISDPWAEVAFDGTIYVSSIGVDAPDGGGNTIFVQTSRDGGATWTRVAMPGADKESLAVDPAVPGRAWVTWTEFNQGQFVSRTDDFGAHWSEPKSTGDPGGYSVHDVHLLPMGGDRLVALTSQTGSFRDEDVDLVARTSEDAGQTWSGPSIVTKYSVNSALDAGGLTFRADSQIFSAVAGPGGTGYAALQTDSGRIRLARTFDGGLTWSTRSVVGRGPRDAGVPVVAASPNGRSIAVTYISLDRDRKRDRSSTTRYRIAVSHDRGNTWTRFPITATYNARTARNEGRPFIGDYTGLVPLGGDGAFGALVALAKPLAVHGPTDVFFLKP